MSLVPKQTVTDNYHHKKLLLDIEIFFFDITICDVVVEELQKIDAVVKSIVNGETDIIKYERKKWLQSISREMG